MIRLFNLIVLMLICSLSCISSAVSEDVNPAVQSSGFRQPQRTEAVRVPTTGRVARSLPDQYSQQAMPSGGKNQSAQPEVKAKAFSKRITPIDRPKQAGQSQAGNTAPRQAPSIWGTFGALLVVISIIFVIAKLFKKHHPLGSTNLPLEVMEVLGKRPLDARQTIHFVRCGSRILILGSSPAGLEMLSEVLDPVEVDLITGMCRERAHSGRSNNTFLNLFQATQKKSSLSDQSPSVDTFQPIEKPELEQSSGTPVMEEFADYDSAVSRLQHKLHQSSRQSLNENAESGHA